MASYFNTWEQFRRKVDAEKMADAMPFNKEARVTRIEPGEPGYREGFRWAVEVKGGAS